MQPLHELEETFKKLFDKGSPPDLECIQTCTASFEEAFVAQDLSTEIRDFLRQFIVRIFKEFNSQFYDPDHGALLRAAFKYWPVAFRTTAVAISTGVAQWAKGNNETEQQNKIGQDAACRFYGIEYRLDDERGTMSVDELESLRTKLAPLLEKKHQPSMLLWIQACYRTAQELVRKRAAGANKYFASAYDTEKQLGSIFFNRVFLLSMENEKDAHTKIFYLYRAAELGDNAALESLQGIAQYGVNPHFEDIKINTYFLLVQVYLALRMKAFEQFRRARTECDLRTGLPTEMDFITKLRDDSEKEFNRYTAHAVESMGAFLTQSAVLQCYRESLPLDEASLRTRIETIQKGSNGGQLFCFPTGITQFRYVEEQAVPQPDIELVLAQAKYLAKHHRIASSAENTRSAFSNLSNLSVNQDVLPAVSFEVENLCQQARETIEIFCRTVAEQSSDNESVVVLFLCAARTFSVVDPLAGKGETVDQLSRFRHGKWESDIQLAQSRGWSQDRKKTVHEVLSLLAVQQESHENLTKLRDEIEERIKVAQSRKAANEKQAWLLEIGTFQDEIKFAGPFFTVWLEKTADLVNKMNEPECIDPAWMKSYRFWMAQMRLAKTTINQENARFFDAWLKWQPVIAAFSRDGAGEFPPPPPQLLSDHDFWMANLENLVILFSNVVEGVQKIRRELGAHKEISPHDLSEVNRLKEKYQEDHEKIEFESEKQAFHMEMAALTNPYFKNFYDEWCKKVGDTTQVSMRTVRLWMRSLRDFVQLELDETTQSFLWYWLEHQFKRSQMNMDMLDWVIVYVKAQKVPFFADKKINIKSLLSVVISEAVPLETIKDLLDLPQEMNSESSLTARKAPAKKSKQPEVDPALAIAARREIVYNACRAQLRSLAKVMKNPELAELEEARANLAELVKGELVQKKFNQLVGDPEFIRLSRELFNYYCQQLDSKHLRALLEDITSSEHFKFFNQHFRVQLAMPDAYKQLMREIQECLQQRCETALSQVIRNPENDMYFAAFTKALDDCPELLGESCLALSQQEGCRQRLKALAQTSGAAESVRQAIMQRVQSYVVLMTISKSEKSFLGRAQGFSKQNQGRPVLIRHKNKIYIFGNKTKEAVVELKKFQLVLNFPEEGEGPFYSFNPDLPKYLAYYHEFPDHRSYFYNLCEQFHWVVEQRDANWVLVPSQTSLSEEQRCQLWLRALPLDRDFIEAKMRDPSLLAARFLSRVEFGHFFEEEENKADTLLAIRNNLKERCRQAILAVRDAPGNEQYFSNLKDVLNYCYDAGCREQLGRACVELFLVPATRHRFEALACLPGAAVQTQAYATVHPQYRAAMEDMKNQVKGSALVMPDYSTRENLRSTPIHTDAWKRSWEKIGDWPQEVRPQRSVPQQKSSGCCCSCFFCGCCCEDDSERRKQTLLTAPLLEHMQY